MADQDLLDRPAKSPPQTQPGPNRADGYPRANTRGQYRSYVLPPAGSAAAARIAQAQAEIAAADAEAATAESVLAADAAAEGTTWEFDWVPVVGWGAAGLAGGTAIYAAYKLHQAQAAKAKAEQEKKTAEEDQKAESGGGNGAENVKGTGDPCELQPYNKNNCDGQDAHHVIVDMVLRYGTRGDSGSRLTDAPSLDEGDTICLDKAQHKQVHKNLTAAFREMRANSGGNTAPMSEIIDKCIEELEKVKPECKGQFEDLRNRMKNKLGDQPGRINPRPLSPNDPGLKTMQPFTFNK